VSWSEIAFFSYFAFGRKTFGEHLIGHHCYGRALG
jgi:hypothetical protein